MSPLLNYNAASSLTVTGSRHGESTPSSSQSMIYASQRRGGNTIQRTAVQRTKDLANAQHTVPLKDARTRTFPHPRRMERRTTWHLRLTHMLLGHYPIDFSRILDRYKVGSCTASRTLMQVHTGTLPREYYASARKAHCAELDGLCGKLRAAAPLPRHGSHKRIEPASMSSIGGALLKMELRRVPRFAGCGHLVIYVALHQQRSWLSLLQSPHSQPCGTGTLSPASGHHGMGSPTGAQRTASGNDHRHTLVPVCCTLNAVLA